MYLKRTQVGDEGKILHYRLESRLFEAAPLHLQSTA